MAQYITQNDVNQLLDFAVFTAAQKVGLASVPWEPIDKLLGDVRAKDSQLGAALDAFRSSYIAWFQFHDTIAKQGNAGQLTPTESARLAQVANARDRTRIEFIAALKRGEA